MGSFEKFAFISPHGTLRLADDLYMHRQTTTPDDGGQVIYVIELARALSALGHSVDVFARNYDTELVDLELDSKASLLRVIHIPTSAPKYIAKEQFYPYYGEYFFAVCKFIRSFGLNYTAIVGHYADGMLLGAALTEFMQTQGDPATLILVTHSLAVQKAAYVHEELAARLAWDKVSAAYEDCLSRLNLKARFHCERVGIARADGIICVSKAQERLLEFSYSVPPDRVTVIPGGYNQKVFTPVRSVTREVLFANLRPGTPITRETQRLLETDQIVFGYGRLVAAKGVMNAVKSLGHLLDACPNTVYVYAGGSFEFTQSEEQELILRCRKIALDGGYLDRVAFIGHQTQPTIAHWLHVSQTYLHCAPLEPSGLAPLEAMASGTPSVIARTSGVAAFYKHEVHALHCDPGDPKDIARQVSRLLKNREFARKIGDNGRVAARVESLWSTQAQRVLNFIGTRRPNHYP